MRLVWSERARRDLLQIAEFIGRHSWDRAGTYIAEIQSRAQNLSRFPQRGRLIPELSQLAEPPREIIIDEYRLMYRIHKNRIEVSRVIHGRRRFQSAL